MFEKVETRFIWKFLQLVIHESWKEKECELGLLQFNVGKHNVLKPPYNFEVHHISKAFTMSSVLCLFLLQLVFSTEFW